MGSSRMSPRSQKEFNEALRSRLTEQQWNKIIDNLIELAGERVPWAMRDLLDRVLGKPQQNVDLSVERKATVADLPALKAELAQLVREDPELMGLVKDETVKAADGTELLPAPSEATEAPEPEESNGDGQS